MIDFINKILFYLTQFFKKKDTNVIASGLLGIGEQKEDHIFWSTVSAIEEIKKRGHVDRQPVYEYNQWALYETRNWCTIFSAVTEVSHLMDYQYTIDEILVIGRKMVADWVLDPNRGWYLHKAIDYVRKDWNERFPDNQIESFRIDYTNKVLRDFLIYDMPRLTQLGYRTSKELIDDFQDIGYNTKGIYPKIGGHAVTKYGLHIIDNYNGRIRNGKAFKNRYSIEHIDKLLSNKIVFTLGYMFLRKM